MEHWVPAHLSVADPIAFAYDSVETMDRYNLLQYFAFLVPSVQYAVNVLMSYPKAVKDRVQSCTRSPGSRLHLNSPYQPTLGPSLPLSE